MRSKRFDRRRKGLLSSVEAVMVSEGRLNAKQYSSDIVILQGTLNEDDGEEDPEEIEERKYSPQNHMPRNT